MDQGLLHAAFEAGVGDEWPTWVGRPDYCASDVLETARRVAKILKSVSDGRSHSECLEIVARACGKADWHELHTVATRIIDEKAKRGFDPSMSADEERLARLASAFPMLTTPGEGIAPTVSERRGMETFAQRLSSEAGMALEIALDVQARRFGVPTWAALLSRQPEDQQGPLYSFHVEEIEGESIGRFVWSPLCRSLVSRQDNYVQGYRDLSEEHQSRAQDVMESILSKRPDFWEGWLMRAGIRMDEDLSKKGLSQAKAEFSRGVKGAEALIPEGFRGRIEWSYIENRFYHRLLYGLMMAKIFTDQLPSAIALARKQLGYNPEDNLGVRYWLPLLLLANSDLDGAQRTLDLIAPSEPSQGESERWSTPDVCWIRSAVCMAQGDFPTAEREALMALFTWPFLRRVVENRGGGVLNPAKSDSRWILPDVQTTLDMGFLLRAHVPEVFAFWRQLYARADVLAAEKELARMHVEARTHHEPELRRAWSARCVELVGQLTGGSPQAS